MNGSKVYLFGYGSLLNLESAPKTLRRSVHASDVLFIASRQSASSEQLNAIVKNIKANVEEA